MSDIHCEVPRSIEEVAGAVMMAAPGELQSLFLVQEGLGQLAGALREGQPAAAGLAELLGQASAKLIADGEGVAEEPLEILARGVAVLQGMSLAHERGLREVAVAPELREELEELAQVAPGRGPEEAAGASAAVVFAAPQHQQMTNDQMGPLNGRVVFQGEDLAGRQIEVASRKVEVANLGDLSVLGQIQIALEELDGLLVPQQTVARDLIGMLGMIIEKIILEEYQEPDQALDRLRQGIGLLQRLQADWATAGRDEDAVAAEPLFLDIARLAAGEPGPAGETEKTGAPEEPLLEVDVVRNETDLTSREEEVPPEHPVEPAEEPQRLQKGYALPPPVEVDADIFLDFQSEAEEHLRTAESILLALENNPEDGELLNTLFRSFHTIKGASGFLNLFDVTRVAHAVEDLLDSVRKKQLKMSPAIADVALDAIDRLKELLKGVAEQLPSGAVQARDVAGFLERVAAAAAGEEEVVARAAAAVVPTAAESPPDPAAGSSNWPAQETATGANGQSSKKRGQQHVRVDTEKLDSLVNLVGELVIAQTQVAQNPDVVGSTNQKLSKDIAQLMKISGDLQEISMSLRMVPIKATFERMARMVRDLGRKCGKKVEFRMRGEETELDKNVVEEIVDPLTHMVRNAVDHGIEAPEVRRAAGKPEEGQVVLEAYHKGGHIVIQLRDDGKGIDRDQVLRKAIDRGLVEPDAELTDKEIFMLIFHPGLSTAEKISEVSGRGVGMDVVRRNIELLRGKVEVESEAGRGSVFTIRLPLTLAIIDGMVIGVGRERYILPLTSIVSSLRPRSEQISTVLHRGEMVKVQDELFPLSRLHQRFGVEARHVDPCQGLVVLIEAEGNRCCLLVDELVGLQQVVIKGLNEELRQDPCLSGCAILGDGRVGLILDASGLVENAHRGGKQWNDVYPKAG